MSDIRAAAEKTAEFPQVLLFTLAEVEATTNFFRHRWPEARVVCDPEKVVYNAFGRRLGRPRDFMSPRPIARYISAMFRGHFPGRLGGNLRVMPGLFLVRGRAVVWEHEFAHAGDHPDLADLPSIAAGTDASRKS